MRRSAVRRSALAVVVALAAATLALTTGTAAAAPPTFVAAANSVARSGTSTTATLPAVAAGDTLVVFVSWDNSALVRLSDSAGDVWQPVTPRQAWGAGNTSSAQTFVAPASGGSTAITATFSTPIVKFGQVYANEYRNVGAVDAASARKGTTGAMTVPALSTTQAGDLLFAAGASSNTITSAASGWTTRSTAYANRTADATAGAPGAYTTSMNQNGDQWVLQLVALRATDPSSTTTTSTSTSTTSTSSTTTTSTSTSTTTSTTMPDDGHEHMGSDVCMFQTFCDNFSTPKPGGRGGDLDESKWSFTRLSQESNPSQGSVNKFVPVNAEFCTTHQVRLADADSFVCGEQFGEANHWMEAIYDNGSYVMNSNRITQPFDFAGRTGTFDFSVDAKSTGPHGTWIEVWLTADPMQEPHTDKPGTHIFPRSGLGFTFDSNQCGRLTGNSLTTIDTFRNYQQTNIHAVSPCFSTHDDMANHFQLKVAVDHVEVWASEADGSNFRQIANVPVSLDFTRGYWHLEHAQYNGSKECSGCPNQNTYHWHAVSFDGPVVPNDRVYQVPDSLISTCGGNNNECGVNLGYSPGYNPALSRWTIPGVDLTGAASAVLTYNAWYTCCNPKAVQVTVNGHVHQVPDANPDAATGSGDVWRSTVMPVPLSELQAGSNAVVIDMPPGAHCAGSCPSIANIDLELIQ